MFISKITQMFRIFYKQLPNLPWKFKSLVEKFSKTFNFLEQSLSKKMLCTFFWRSRNLNRKTKHVLQRGHENFVHKGTFFVPIHMQMFFIASLSSLVYDCHKICWQPFKSWKTIIVMVYFKCSLWSSCMRKGFFWRSLLDNCRKTKDGRIEFDLQMLKHLQKQVLYLQLLSPILNSVVI